jgi:hypothetical protein
MPEGQSEKKAPLFDNMGFINATENDIAPKYMPFCDLPPLRISQMLWINTYNTPSFALLDINGKLMACFACFSHGLLTVCKSGHAKIFKFFDLECEPNSEKYKFSTIVKTHNICRQSFGWRNNKTKWEQYSRSGYSPGFQAISWRIMMGAANRADFPSPIAVQHKMSLPLRIQTTRFSCHICSPSYSGTSSLMILMIVALPSGSCH